MKCGQNPALGKLYTQDYTHKVMQEASEAVAASEAVTLEALGSMRGVIQTYPAKVDGAAVRVVLFKARDCFEWCDTPGPGFDFQPRTEPRPTHLSCGTPLLWYDVEDPATYANNSVGTTDDAVENEVWTASDRSHVWVANSDPALSALMSKHRNVRSASIRKRRGAFVLTLGVTAKGAIPDGEEAFPESIVLAGVPHAIEVCAGWSEFT